MFDCFNISLNAVLQLVFCALIGVYLARRGHFLPDARKSLAKIIMTVMLPALLIISLGKEINLGMIRQYFGVMLLAPLLIIANLLLSALLNRLIRVPREFRRMVTAAGAFGNASYIPIPFLAALCAGVIFPGLTPEQAAAKSVTYISLYLMCYSPLLWTIGFPYISGTTFRNITLSRLISPPIIGSAIGITVAFTPFLRSLLFDDTTLVPFIRDTLRTLAAAVFPCALLLIGANLSGTKTDKTNHPDTPGTPSGHCPLSCYIGVIAAKLLLMPLIGIAYAHLTWEHGLIPRDPVLMLVILVESAVPPANNLIIMCQMNSYGEVQMSRLLFAAYCASCITLTAWTVFFLRLVNHYSPLAF